MRERGEETGSQGGRLDHHHPGGALYFPGPQTGRQLLSFSVTEESECRGLTMSPESVAVLTSASVDGTLGVSLSPVCDIGPSHSEKKVFANDPKLTRGH